MTTTTIMMVLPPGIVQGTWYRRICGQGAPISLPYIFSCYYCQILLQPTTLLASLQWSPWVIALRFVASGPFYMVLPSSISDHCNRCMLPYLLRLVKLRWITDGDNHQHVDMVTPITSYSIKVTLAIPNWRLPNTPNCKVQRACLVRIQNLPCQY